ncbi:MAG: hypothetical protein KBD65_02370 [Candidatus Moranbacteria bacterium]|nr:hypothetical protein [Candidatus Moranbacteria bacterium]
MRLLFGILYTFLFFSYVATALFVIFHLLRYSLNRRMAVLSTTLFVTVLFLLLVANALLFFTLPFEDMLPLLIFS